MFRALVFLLVILNFLPVNAEIIRTNTLGNNNFHSKLRMNQPKTIYTAPLTSTRQNRYRPRHCPSCNHYNPYLRKEDLNALEKYALNKTYRRDNDLQRLERLENLAFGATQYGDINSRYKNVENAILSRPKFGTKNSFLNNVANYFAGQTTGFTPSLIQYPSYNNLGGFSSFTNSYYPGGNYGNTNNEQYSNGIFGGGWGISGQNYGTGSSIRILD